jgi:hypothetical protein
VIVVAVIGMVSVVPSDSLAELGIETLSKTGLRNAHVIGIRKTRIGPISIGLTSLRLG